LILNFGAVGRGLLSLIHVISIFSLLRFISNSLRAYILFALLCLYSVSTQFVNFGFSLICLLFQCDSFGLLFPFYLSNFLFCFLFWNLRTFLLSFDFLFLITLYYFQTSLFIFFSFILCLFFPWKISFILFFLIILQFSFLSSFTFILVTFFSFSFFS
jgi:hypothetical protein